ncbi:MAG: nucleotidyl transferase AbiEii/AbiGii toxin family protein [Candidatus Omnitrophica bacterium]|nr:nucleotidyl transferase AbiEii/AbiGii toxin family protein [Candidatus Omnitrophota bacterium]
MQDLTLQEKFELEVLDRLNSGKLLSSVVFGGGTMLRLCHGLNRFSADLDFWVIKSVNATRLFNDYKKLLGAKYTLVDSADKFYTILFELRSKEYPRSLKIEIRKEKKKVSIEPAIAYSRYSTTQVFLNTVSLPDMMQSKLEALISRKEIRDAFDMEYLVKRGIKVAGPKDTLNKALKTIEGFKKADYTVKLGSLLEAEERKYYAKENFKILKREIAELCAK